MPSRLYDDNPDRHIPGPARRPPKTGARSNSSPAFREKPGFPSASLPGKAQARDRSGGVKKLKVCADSKGL